MYIFSYFRSILCILEILVTLFCTCYRLYFNNLIFYFLHNNSFCFIPLSVNSSEDNNECLICPKKSLNVLWSTNGKDSLHRFIEPVADIYAGSTGYCGPDKEWLVTWQPGGAAPPDSPDEGDQSRLPWCHNEGNS